MSELTKQLHIAINKGDLTKVRRVLSAGANPNATDLKGMTPLHLAIYATNIPIIQTLLSAGANPNIPNKEGYTPLHFAAEYICDIGLDTNEEINDYVATTVGNFLSAGANPNATDRDGRTPLHLAVYATIVPMAQALLSAGANPNIPNKEGDTPLHFAGGYIYELEPDTNEYIKVINDYITTIGILIDYEANPMIRNKKGETPVESIEDDTLRNTLIGELKKRGFVQSKRRHSPDSSDDELANLMDDVDISNKRRRYFGRNRR